MEEAIDKTRKHLIKAAGWTSQDFGLGRSIGEVMAAVYLHNGPASLDDIADVLDASKAAVSISTRQLDKLGLLQRIKVPNDRKTYYKPTEHFAAALQHGIFEMLRNKLKAAEEVFDQADMFLSEADTSTEKEFLKQQIDRAKRIRSQSDRLLNNPILKFIAR